MFTKIINQKLKKPFEGTWWGDFLSKLKGEGLEVEDMRLYQPWDEVKNINWKLTARTGKIYINVFRATKDVDFHIFLDININWFETRKNKKVYEAILEDISHIYLWFRQKKANIKLFWPQGKSTKVAKVTRLWELMLPFYGLRVHKKYQSWLKTFLRYQTKVKKRRVILIISDLLAADEKDVKILRWLSKFNEVFVHSLFDFDEIGIWGNFDYLSFAHNSYLDELKDLLI